MNVAEETHAAADVERTASESQQCADVRNDHQIRSLYCPWVHHTTDEYAIKKTFEDLCLADVEAVDFLDGPAKYGQVQSYRVFIHIKQWYHNAFAKAIQEDLLATTGELKLELVQPQRYWMIRINKGSKPPQTPFERYVGKQLRHMRRIQGQTEQKLRNIERIHEQLSAIEARLSQIETHHLRHVDARINRIEESSI